MTPNELGSIRRSQVVSTYGPGSIVDFRAGSKGDAAISCVAAGLETWLLRDAEREMDATRIQEPRLSKILGVSHFRLAPVAPRRPRWQQQRASNVFLQGRRFPHWLQCPRCHRIGSYDVWTQAPGDPALTCPQCSTQNDRAVCVPVRFVMTCANGHLDDFPWSRWVHEDGPCERPKLKLEAKGTGLASLVLSCGTCNAARPMEGALSKKAFADRGWICRAKRPWLDDDEGTCDAAPIAVQRGASNLYFAQTLSSLDIPPWSHPLVRMLGANWEVLITAPENERPVTLKSLDRTHKYSTRLGMSQEEILATIAERLELLKTMTADNLRGEEYQRLAEPMKDSSSEDEFRTRAHAVPARLASSVRGLIEVQRLREVRALRGFTRLAPPTEEPKDQARIAKLSRERLDWLPAVEVRGEGIFLELDPKAVSGWQTQHHSLIQPLLASIQKRYEQSWLELGREGELPKQPITASFLLIHTLAHALIRQLSLDCGYSSASLRERLYVQDEEPRMTGLLIYTGSSDADGTLGGLSRQAQPARFEQFFIDAVRNLAWCSNDPLCIHGEASSEPLNRAACHSCALVAETSCERFNQLLDRSVLVGTPQHRELGFFAPLLRSS